MAMRNTILFPAILAMALWAAACGSSEPETVTAAAPDETSQPAAPTPAEGDPADGASDDSGSSSDDGGSSADDESSTSGEDGAAGDSDSGDERLLR